MTGRGSAPDPGGEIVAIVDGHNRVLGGLPRRRMREQGLLHRATYLLVFDSRGRILVQRRTACKDVFPGLLDVAAGGVVRHGEEYAESARRELHEELGVTAAPRAEFEIYFEDARASPGNRGWGRVFSLTCDGPFTLQAEEVEQAWFAPVDEVLALDPATLTPDTRQVLLTWLL